MRGGAHAGGRGAGDGAAVVPEDDEDAKGEAELLHRCVVVGRETLRGGGGEGWEG